MPNRALLDYKFRFLDYRNHLNGTRELKFEDDQLACHCAEHLFETGAIEVWQGNRLVARVDEAGTHYAPAVAPKSAAKAGLGRA
jgi:hypothetical protein